MSEARSCPSKEALVTALYGEASPEDRRDLERHLAACPDCRDEFESLGALRLALQEWDAPAPSARLLVVSEASGAGREAAAARVLPGPSRWWSSRGLYGAGLAAAATLVLGMAAGLANLDVTIGPQGLNVKTGRGHAEPVAATPSPAEVAPASIDPVAAGGHSRGASVTLAAAPTPEPWRAELAALERRLVTELEARGAAGGPRVRQASVATVDEQWLRRVQELIDASETRQQRNLAQRVTELAREFDVQRRTDLVSIQQGLGQLEGRTQAEVARTRELMNLIVRTSGGTPPR